MGECVKDIVIIANFCRDFSETDNGRFMYLCKELSKEHKVEIITSDFGHSAKKHKEPLHHKWPFTITFLHEPGYKKNISIQRFASHHAWGKEVEKYLRKRKKPDVIYCAVPSLTAPLKAAKYCEKNGVKFVIDVQDLWPEAFQMVFNIPVISSIVFAPFKFLANGIYKRADEICAVSDTYCERAKSVNKKVSDTTTVFLGTELATFDRYASENPILEKKDGEIWIAYCGSLESSYDLTCVIDALGKLNDSRIHFIVMGKGSKLEEFKAYAEKKQVRATFVGRLQYNAMCSLLSACDITVNPITHMAAQSIINKHGDYAASGLPVVSTQENPEYRQLVDEYHMGFNCNNNDADDLAEKIQILVNDEELRLQMGRNARKCAEERFDRAATYEQIKTKVLTNRGGTAD